MPTDVMANLKVTELKHKNPKIANATAPTGRNLFTPEQAKQIKTWIEIKRNGHRYLPLGAREELLQWVRNELEINVSKDSLFNWMRRDYNDKYAKSFYTQEQLDTVHNWKYIQGKSWQEVAKLYNGKWNDKKKWTALRTALVKHLANYTTGPWSEEECAELLRQYEIHHTSWSKYSINKRDPDNIRNKFNNLLKSFITKAKGQPFTRLLLSAFDRGVNENGTITKDDWLEALHKTYPDMKMEQAKFIFKQSLSTLLTRGRILRLKNGTYERGSKERVVHPNRKRKAPLRSTLTEEQLSHVVKLIRQCDIERKKNAPNLDWFGSENFTSIATTTSYPEPRRLDFVPIEQSFEDDNVRRNWRRIFEDDNDDTNSMDDGSESEDDDFQDDGFAIDQCEELINLHEERADRGIRVLGVIPLSSSKDETKNCLFFFTTHTDVLDHIYKELMDIRLLTGCPSWIDAFATNLSDINWGHIKLLAVAQGYTAALRLKLCTATLTGATCFNVRKSIFPPIATGRDSYIVTLQNAGVSVDILELERMVRRIDAED